MQIISGFGSSLYWLKSEEAVRDGLDRYTGTVLATTAIIHVLMAGNSAISRNGPWLASCRRL